MNNKILIVGLGSIGKRHLRLARELIPNADIRVLRHELTEEVPEFSNGCFFDIKDAVSFAPLLAVIASPAPFHIATAQVLAEAGIHLLIEKPLSSSLRGVKELIDTCHINNLILLTGYNLRFTQSLKRYRELLKKKVVGKVLSVRCEIGQNLLSWRPEVDYRKSVSAIHDMGGGVLLELSHELDYLRWIFGEVSWVKATLSRQSNLEIDVEDSAFLTLGFTTASEEQQLIASVNLDFIRHDATRVCIAIGENGSLRWNGLTGAVEIFEIGSEKWRELFRSTHQRDDSYLAEWKEFLECIKNCKKPLVTGEDGLKALQIIEAARSSAKSGGQIFEVGSCS